MTAAPNSTYIACFPLQEAIIDKDTGLPLAAGVVSFFQDEARTVPKNVYYQTGGPPPTPYTFATLGVGGVVTLSSIGTFVDGSGNNVIPFLWPYVGDPASPPSPLVAQAYYITVTSASPALISQFTVSNWPPNLGSASTPTSGAINSINTQTFSSGSTTYTPTSGMTYAIVECMGAGGGGGGTASAGANAQVTGGGGGAGGYSRKRISAADVVSPQTVTVGAIGTGGAAGNNPGTDGTASSLGSLCIGRGGGGGGIASVQTGGAGATAGTGDLTGTGQPGGSGVGASINTLNVGSGYGGSTQWGGGGLGDHAPGAGVAGSGYGSGGSGGASANTSAAEAGGNGAPGYVIITEYISS